MRWWFALLVRLYPRQWRARSATDLLRLVEDVWSAAATRSLASKAALAARLVVDLTAGALAARLAVSSKRRVSSTRAGHRSERGAHWIGALLADLRFGARQLHRQPIFAVTAIGTLGLGIGGVTAMWSVFYGVLLAPLPYRDSDRLVSVWDNLAATQPAGSRYYAVSTPEYLSWSSSSSTIEEAAAVSFGTRSLEGGEYPVRLPAGLVTWNFFSFLGARPLLGRDFRPGENDPGSDAVVMLSHGLWRTAFAADSTVVGRTVLVNGLPHTIIGVAPPDFVWLEKPELNRNVTVAMWMPRVMDPSNVGHSLQVLARAKPGASTEHVAADLGSLNGRLSPTQEGAGVADPASLVTVEWLHDSLYAPVEDRLILPLGAMTLVLLLACTNVANLLLSRLPGRRSEISTRAALGASRGRLVRQLLIEALVLASAAALLGAALAMVATRAVATLGPQEIARLSDARVDLRSLALCIGVAAACALIYGLLPAWRGSKMRLALQPSAVRSRRGYGFARAALVGGELAVALVLVSCAALMTRSFSRLLGVEMGFEPQGATVAQVYLPAEGLLEPLGVDASTGQPVTRLRPDWIATAQELVSRLEAEPGVEDAAAAMYLGSGLNRSRLRLEGQPASSTPAEAEWRFASQYVGPDYIAAMGARLLKGRDFLAGDASVAVINESLARLYWPDEDPIGKRFWGNEFGSFDGTTFSSAPRIVEVIGVVGDWRELGYADPPRPTMFMPLEDGMGPGRASTPPPIGVVVRSESSAASIEGMLQRIMLEMDHRAPVADVAVLGARVGRTLQAPRFYAFLFSIFGTLALAIAAAGVFGVVAFTVSQRTHEIGVRMALGGQPADVVTIVVRRFAIASALGVVVGVLGTRAVTRLLESWLYEVEPTDPWSLSGAVVLLLAASLTAAWVPARRAVTIDPAKTLRAEG